MQSIEGYIKYFKLMPWRVVFYVVSLSFVVASATAVGVAWLLAARESAAINRFSTAKASQTAVVVSTPVTKDTDIEAILKRNIFNSEGSLGEDAPTSQEDGEQIPKSELPLTLLGVIYGGNPFNGMATIENTAKNSVNSFVVGDMIVKEAKLLEIHRKRVILERDGNKEYIELHEVEVKRSTRNLAKGNRINMPTSLGGASAISSRPAADSYKEEGYERDHGNIQMSENYVHRLLTDDFTKVLQDAKATPNVVDGQTRGFKLTKIRENSIYEKSGLQNDDVVEEINGIPLNDAASAIKTLQGLRNEKDIDLVVRRGSSAIPMKIKVR